jgi:aspartyl-tRNA(Asn)/glutamyl-tRNA(Gln) amidotransferase subunit A
MDLLTARISEVVNAIKNQTITAVEVVSFFLNRIEKMNPKINAFVAVNADAINEAKKIDQQVKNNQKVGDLAGIPFGIKDMLCTKGIKTTAASKMLKDFVPPYDATLVKKLKEQGAIILGKLNQDEFAMGSSGETSYFGPCKNPWNDKVVPGGSSGGSAAAQAARLCMATIGTDTGGSIRQPASFCGVVGVKPSYGRVSRSGIIAFASTLDQAGPITTYIEDAALILKIISGHDPADMTTTRIDVPDFHKNINSNIKGKKFGIIKEFTASEMLDSCVAESMQSAIRDLQSLGAELVEVSIPYVEFAVPVYYLIACSEASSNLARYDGVRYGHREKFEDLSAIDLEEFYGRNRAAGFSAEVKKRIMLGTFCLSSGYYDAYYTKACQVRRLIKDQFDEVFKKCDILLSPISTSTAFEFGFNKQNPLAAYYNDIFTVSANLAGIAGLSVPYAIAKNKLPIGIQFMSASFAEENLLNFGYVIESKKFDLKKVIHELS